MRWKFRKRCLKRWIDRHRQSYYDDAVVIALLPQKCGYYEGADVVWLAPILRQRHCSTWEPVHCLDPGYAGWSTYDKRSNYATWGTWLRTRPLHHLAGLVYFLVYWSWFPAILVGGFWIILRSAGLL